MKKAFVLAGILVAATAGLAAAGAKYGGTVSVSVSGRWAGGGLGGARNSTDTRQDIGCLLQVSGGVEYGYCYATDAAGQTVGCGTTAPAMLATIQGMNSDSWMSFSYDASGTCTYLEVYTASDLEPKK